MQSLDPSFMALEKRVIVSQSTRLAVQGLDLASHAFQGLVAMGNQIDVGTECIDTVACDDRFLMQIRQRGGNEIGHHLSLT